jgi:tubulin---tyrosine ligase
MLSPAGTTPLIKMSFLAWVSFPDAPLTAQLICSALRSNFPAIPIVTSDNPPFESSEVSSSGEEPTLFLQWSTYDSLSHERTHSEPQRVLSSSYTIRKSLIRKHFLHRSLLAYTTKHPDAYLNRSGAVPKTWDIDISWADELDELWSDELWDLGELLDSTDADDLAVPRWFILKPSMSDRGMGIRLFESKEALRDIFLGFEENESDDSDDQIPDSEGDGTEVKDTSVIASQLRHFVIQVNTLSWSS